jgi:SsrA-binding protein
MSIKNRKAYFEYHILKEYVAGMKLVGSEVKSLRQNNCTMSDTYCYTWDGEIFVKNLHISKYEESSWMNHDEKRDRKLLLNKKEINDIIKSTKDNGITIIPLEVFIQNGKFKLKIGVCKGKKVHDKRDSIKKRDIEREIRNSY